MSLINDALKRAKTAQQQTPAAPVGPHLKPVEPQPTARSSMGYFVPTALALVALLALFMIWRFRRQSDLEASIPVRAQQPAAMTTATHSNFSESALQTRTVTAPPEESVAAKPVVSASAGNAQAVAGPQTNAPTLSSSSSQAGGTNLNPSAASTTNVSVSTVAPPQPPPLKLQGVVCDPRRPSAVINGRTLFLGDKIREMRVTAITTDTATLVGAGRTNVLTMAE